MLSTAANNQRPQILSITEFAKRATPAAHRQPVASNVVCLSVLERRQVGRGGGSNPRVGVVRQLFEHARRAGQVGGGG